MTETTIAATGTAGLAARAVHAARAYRAADPAGFGRRHHDDAQWTRWTRRVRVARTIAAALQVPLGWVTVTDDPRRQYRTRGGLVPGDLITITDAATGRAWLFIPDFTTPGDGWLLIDRCPGCEATIPATRIATLADLGDHLDPEGDIWPAEESYDDSAHQPGCGFGPVPATAVTTTGSNR